MNNTILIYIIIEHNIIHLLSFNLVFFEILLYNILMSIIIFINIIFEYNYTHHEIEESCYIPKI